MDGAGEAPPTAGSWLNDQCESRQGLTGRDVVRVLSLGGDELLEGVGQRGGDGAPVAAAATQDAVVQPGLGEVNVTGRRRAERCVVVQVGRLQQGGGGAAGGGGAGAHGGTRPVSVRGEHPRQCATKCTIRARWGTRWGRHDGGQKQPFSQTTLASQIEVVLKCLATGRARVRDQGAAAACQRSELDSQSPTVAARD